MKCICLTTNICPEALVANRNKRRNRVGSQTRVLGGLRMLIAAAAFLLMSVGGDDAQAQLISFFQSLYSFTNGADGAGPYPGLILSGATLYGTTHGGGANGNGTVFAVNTDGTDFMVLHAFSGFSGGNGFYGTNFDGAEPYGGLVLSSNTVYGTTFEGGTVGFGTVFAVNTDTTGFTTVHSFDSGGGGWSYAGLIITGNTLYGTTQLGYPKFDGNVFAMHTDGTEFASLFSFNGGADGGRPYANLLLSGNTLYGTASEDGASGLGTVFAVNTDGTGFTVLHSFTNSPDGSNPYGGLVLSGDMLYGTAAYGGTNGYGTVFGVNTNGTGFTVLHAFNGLDGSDPNASLILSGNTLYGTTAGNTVFCVNTDGTDFDVLHRFQGPDGETPWGSLVLSGNTLYGTTFEGGWTNCGTVFAITLVSIPAIEQNSMSVSGGQLQFSVTGLTPGETVYVQASSDLSATGKWFPVATNVASATNLTISGLSVTNASCRFFRVLETSPP